MNGQVFISYRHVEPDESIARQMDDYLRGLGLPVFRDNRIEVGRKWVAEIDRQVRASRFFVVLLSRDSIKSDMVRQEIRLAYELAQQGEMRIFPVRLAFKGALPYDLAAYLDPIQYAFWKSGEPFELICEIIGAAIQGESGLPLENTDDSLDAVLEVGDSEHEDGTLGPLPTADPRIVMETGTVRLDSPFYVQRRADEEVASALRQPDRGETLVIKGTRQSGKSSLLARAHALATSLGLRSVYLDLQRIDSKDFESLSSLFKALAWRITRAVKSPIKPGDVWEDSLGDKESFSYFLEQALLEPADGQVLLCLDEVDRVFSFDYRNDFFSTIRAWHNSRATDPLWDQLHIAIAHATDPSLWIDDLNQSPFNVGTRLRLGPFDLAEVRDLNARHQSPLRDNDEVVSLHSLLGGQPYLVRQALYVMHSQAKPMEDLQAEAIEDAGPFGDHLRRLLWGLHQRTELAEEIRRVILKGECRDEMVFQRLLAGGLIVGTSRTDAQAFCLLYHDYFRKHL